MCTAWTHDMAQALPCTPTMLATVRHCSHSLSHCYPWRQCRLVVLAWAHDHHASHHSNHPSTGCRMHGQSLVLVHVMASWADAHSAQSPERGAGGRWCWSWVVVGGLVHPLDMRHAPSAIIPSQRAAPGVNAQASPACQSNRRTLCCLPNPWPCTPIAGSTCSRCRLTLQTPACTLGAASAQHVSGRYNRVHLQRQHPTYCITCTPPRSGASAHTQPYRGTAAPPVFPRAPKVHNQHWVPPLGGTTHNCAHRCPTEPRRSRVLG